MNTPISNIPLTWHELQQSLRECKTEADAQRLLDEEKKGQARVRWLMRIQGRLRVLRNERENAELTALTSKGE